MPLKRKCAMLLKFLVVIVHYVLARTRQQLLLLNFIGLWVNVKPFKALSQEEQNRIKASNKLVKKQKLAQKKIIVWIFCTLLAIALIITSSI